MNRKAIAIIAATVAAFSLNAASCEQLAPTPAVEVFVDELGIDQAVEAVPAPSGPWVREGATFNLMMRPTADVRERCLALGGEPAFIPGNVVDPSYGEAKVYVCLNVPSSTITG